MDRSGNIIRERLIVRLNTIESDALVLLVAGAGYGKSTLLAQWAARSNRPISIASLKDADDDVRGLGLVIARTVASVVPEARSLVDRAAAPEPDWICDLLPELIAVAARHDFVLVLDDIHVVRSRSALKLLAAVAETWPAPNQLVLSGRTRPSFPIVRRRLGAAIRVVTGEDLDFDGDEIAELLARHDSDVKDAAKLLADTGGWPAGARLVAMRRLEQGGRHSGDSLTIDDFLDAYVLEDLAPQDADFLEHVAAVVPAPVALIERVLNRDDVLTVLRDLQHRGTPMMDLPAEEGGDVGLHSLLAERLVERFRERDPERLSELVRSAARSAQRAGNLDYSFSLLERRVGGEDLITMPYRMMGLLVLNGRIDLLTGWLERFDPKLVRDRAVLGIPMAQTMRPRREGQLREWLAQYGDDTATILPDGNTPSVVVDQMLTAFGFKRANPDAEPANAGWRQTWGVTRAWDLYADDRLDEAEAVLLGRAEEAPAFSQINAVRLATLAVLALETGRIDDALQRSDAAAVCLEGEFTRNQANTYFIEAVAMKLARERGDLAEAERLAQTVRVKIALIGDATMRERVWSLASVANLYLDLHYPLASARELHDEAKRILNGRPASFRLDRMLAELRYRIASTPVVSEPMRRGATLTTAELRVLHYLPSHLTIPRIADELARGGSTIKTQCMSIYRKLGVTGRDEAVLAARLLGLLPPAG